MRNILKWTSLLDARGCDSTLIDLDYRETQDVHRGSSILTIPSDIRSYLKHLTDVEGCDGKQVWEDIKAVVAESIISGEKILTHAVSTNVKNRYVHWPVIAPTMCTHRVSSPLVLCMPHAIAAS